MVARHYSELARTVRNVMRNQCCVRISISSNHVRDGMKSIIPSNLPGMIRTTNKRTNNRPIEQGTMEKKRLNARTIERSKD